MSIKQIRHAVLDTCLNMSWKHIKGFNEIEDILRCLKDIELLCISEAKSNESTDIESEYLKHKIKLFELYNSACTVLDDLESNSGRPKLLLKVKLQDLIDQMKIEIRELRKLCNKSSGCNSFKATKKRIDYREIEEYEREFIVITKSRFDKLFAIPISEATHSITLADLMLKTDLVNTFEDNTITISDRKKISEWNLENKRIDGDIKEIGDAALKIAEKAERLGCEARLQNMDIEEIKATTELATTNISNLNRKVQEVIGTNSNTTFCCRITLVTLVFIAISAIIALVFKKLI